MQVETAELFAGAVASLPEAVRRRLDGGAPLDWTALETSRIAAALGAAAGDRRRLPEPVEALVHRLVRDVGIVPADVAEGIERQGAAGVWIDRVSIETEGDAYRILNHVSGELHAGIRADAIAGYAMLALELATEVHETGERWLKAGERFCAAPEDKLCPLARCAVRMRAHLRAAPEPCPGRRTTILAHILETAWNSQDLRQRAELAAALRPNGASGVCAPRPCHFAPLTGYRLHACDLHEIRWLRALAERAGQGAPEHAATESEPAAATAARPDETPPKWPEAESLHADAPEADFEQLALQEELAALDALIRQSPETGQVRPNGETALPMPFGEDGLSLDMAVLEERIRAEAGGTFRLGSPPEEIRLDAQLAALGQAAGDLPGAVRRRLAAAYGVDAMHALTRLEDRREVDALLAGLTVAGSPPRWLENLAATLLIDAGAETRDGVRTAGLRLDPGEQQDGEYLATEEKTGARATLSVAGLLQQMHLGLTFARNASTALTVFRSAGKEGGWALREEKNGCAGFTPGDGETLDAAQRIGWALDRILDTRPGGDRQPSALEQAAMAADVVAAVGPTVRAAVGWPGAADAPNAADPGDVARIVAVAEALQGNVRSITNRLIAGQMVGFMSRPLEQDA